jgi:hypothetical protein
MKITILIFLLISIQTTAQNLSGVITVGYGSLYNYETANADKFRSNLVRLNPVLMYNDILLEFDVQARDLEKTASPFIWGGGGYRVMDYTNFPDIWLMGSYLYSDVFDRNDLPFNQVISSPGVGCMLGMKGRWLKKSFANFSMSYYPHHNALYKSMQLGWEIYKLGFSAGGIGIRIPEGRYYSSFVFSVRYAFGKEFDKK